MSISNSPVASSPGDKAAVAAPAPVLAAVANNSLSVESFQQLQATETVAVAPLRQETMAADKFARAA